MCSFQDSWLCTSPTHSVRKMTAMNISFVYPDFENLGTEYLIAACLDEGHCVDYYFYKSQDIIFNQKRQPDFEQLARDILRSDPHVVAFSCVTDNFRNQLECAREVKRIRPEVVTIFGGVHTTAVPETVIKHRCVDCVGLGESEESLCRFLEAGSLCGDNFCLPHHAVPGFVFKFNGEIIGKFRLPAWPDLNLLPIPHKDMVYRWLPEIATEYQVMTSRGCPFRCAYCFNSFFFDKKHPGHMRRRAIDNVVAELLVAKDRFFPKSIFFIDDCFTSDPGWLLPFLEEYRRMVALPFSCSTHPLFVNGEVVEALKRANCVHVNVGVQSLSDQICKNVINRKGSRKRIGEALQTLKKWKILVTVDHMLGIPGDTLEIEEESVLFYNKYRPWTISVYWLCYYPKTAILQIAKERGLITEGDIVKLNEGYRVKKSFLVMDGDSENPDQFRGIGFILNWLGFLPKSVVNWLISSGLYKRLNIKNYYFAVVLPRLFRCFHPKNFRGRYHLTRFIKQMVFEFRSRMESARRYLWKNTKNDI